MKCNLPLLSISKVMWFVRQYSYCVVPLCDLLASHCVYLCASKPVPLAGTFTPCECLYVSLLVYVFLYVRASLRVHVLVHVLCVT